MVLYEILKIAGGTIEIVDRQRDANVAQQHAIEQSRIVDAVFAVQRQGFGAPMYFVWRGSVHSGMETIRRVSMPSTPPVVALESPEPEAKPILPVEKPEGSTGATRKPKPRRTRKKPTETKARIHKVSETKAMPGAVISTDDETGIIRAIVSVFGIIDDGDDIIHPGAFTKTIVEQAGRIRVLNSHNNRDGLNVIGKAIALREIGRNELPLEILNDHPEATGGLETETQFLITTPEGKGIYDRIKAGALNEWSIGFDAVDTDNSRMKRKSADDPVWEMAIKTKKYDPDSDPLTLKDENGKPRIVRNIRAIRLWEYSSVIWGMNESTTTVSVKDKPRADGKAVDTEPSPLFGEWLVSQIMSQCMSILEGAQWGGLLDEIEHQTLTELCNSHIEMIRTEMAQDIALRPMVAAYLLMSANDPDSRKEHTPQGAIRRFGDTLLADFIQGGTGVLTGKLSSGMVSAEEFTLLMGLYTQHVNEFRSDMPDDIALREMAQDMFWFSGNGPDDTKAGRVLNERNFNSITQAAELLNKVLASASLTDSDPAEDADKSRHDSTEDDATDGPSVSTNAPTPSHEDGAGPQDDDTPATKQADLLEQLNERLAED